MPVDNGGKRGSQVGQRINRIELARFDKRCDSGLGLSSSIVARKERVLAVQGYRPDGALDAVVIHLDTAISQEELQTIPIFAM